MSDPAEIEVLPVLPSVNLAETKAFYTEKLGLSEVVHEDESYLILRRPGLELHFWLTDDKTLCERTSVYIRGGGIDALYAEYEMRDILHPMGFTEREWGMKEFYVSDPHGNLLRFGRIPDGQEA
ncbi:VOC family protein [Martelella mediterranea]|uniref:bleomycin resistance protein n=1 Tax=Martelella mediterranea TaxID=293089 RepID=UPI001E49414D|nr:VOC family protein [Martelella mediterranea]MCD1633062.1 VOC family protein [Martelella mediterranea]